MLKQLQYSFWSARTWVLGIHEHTHGGMSLVEWSCAHNICPTWLMTMTTVLLKNGDSWLKIHGRCLSDVWRLLYVACNCVRPTLDISFEDYYYYSYYGFIKYHYLMTVPQIMMLGNCKLGTGSRLLRGSFKGLFWDYSPRYELSSIHGSSFIFN